MKKTKGFTLIEIMVTVVIVGVLASLAFSSYQRFMLIQKERRTMQEMEKIKAALEIYRVKYNKYIPDNTFHIYPIKICGEETGVQNNFDVKATYGLEIIPEKNMCYEIFSRSTSDPPHYRMFSSFYPPPTANDVFCLTTSSNDVDLFCYRHIFSGRWCNCNVVKLIHNP